MGAMTFHGVRVSEDPDVPARRRSGRLPMAAVPGHGAAAYRAGGDASCEGGSATASRWLTVIGRSATSALDAPIGTCFGERAARIVARVDPSDQLPPPEREILRSGPTRAPLLDRLASTRRRRGVVLIAFVLGVVAGGGATWWWDGWPSRDARAPSPPTAAGAEVRLVLSGVVAPTPSNGRNGPGGNDPLLIDAVLLHGRGPGIATVVRIHRPGGSLAIRAAALPVRLSVNHSFERVRLKITARDCGLAAEWTPSAQPFTLTWQDDHGDIRTDTGGDHDTSMELELIRYFDAICGSQPAR
jgi:hypothetical protein